MPITPKNPRLSNPILASRRRAALGQVRSILAGVLLMSALHGQTVFTNPFSNLQLLGTQNQIGDNISSAPLITSSHALLIAADAELVITSGGVFRADTGSVVDLYHATLSLPDNLTLSDVKVEGSSAQVASGATLSLLDGSSLVAVAGSSVDLSAANVIWPAEVVLTTGAQTLRGKTLDSPVISTISSEALTDLTLSGHGNGASLALRQGSNGSMTLAANTFHTNAGYSLTSYNGGFINDVMAMGFNVAPTGELKLPSEFQMYDGWESNYDNHGLPTMERYIRFVTPDGLQMYEPFFTSFDRNQRRINYTVLRGELVQIDHGDGSGPHARFENSGISLYNYTTVVGALTAMETSAADFVGVFSNNINPAGNSVVRAGFNDNLASDFQQNADGRLYIKNRYNDPASGIIFQLRANGSPVSPLTLEAGRVNIPLTDNATPGGAGSLTTAGGIFATKHILGSRFGALKSANGSASSPVEDAALTYFTNPTDINAGLYFVNRLESDSAVSLRFKTTKSDRTTATALILDEDQNALVTGNVSVSGTGASTIAGNLLIGGGTNIPGVGGLKVFGGSASTSTTSGALQVVGGAGIGGDLQLGGRLVLAGGGNASTGLWLDGAQSLYAAGSNQLVYDQGGTGNAYLSIRGGGASSVGILAGSTAGGIQGGFLSWQTPPGGESMRIGVGATEVARATGSSLGSGSFLVGYTTPSSSKSSGAFQVAGGAGVGGALNVGGDIATEGAFSSGGSGTFGGGIRIKRDYGDSNELSFLSSSGSTTYGLIGVASSSGALSTGSVAQDVVVRSESGLRLTSGGATDRLTISASDGAVAITSTVPANSNSTGALVVAGGLGVAGDQHLAGALRFSNTGVITAGGGLTLTAGGNDTDVTLEPGGSGKVTTPASLVAAGGIVTTSTAASVSATTGALVVAGGFGLGGNQTIGGTLNFSGEGVLAAGGGLALLSGGAVSILAGGLDKDITLTPSGSGRVIVNGPSLFANAPTLGSGLNFSGGSAILDSSGSLTLAAGGANKDIVLSPSGGGRVLTAGGISTSAATPSTSVATGALVVAGGMGLGGDLFLGGAMNLPGGAVVSGNLGNLHLSASGTDRDIIMTPSGTGVIRAAAGMLVSGAMMSTATTPSNSLSTGALIIAGGAAIAKRTHLGDDLVLAPTVAPSATIRLSGATIPDTPGIWFKDAGSPSASNVSLSGNDTTTVVNGPVGGMVDLRVGDSTYLRAGTSEVRVSHVPLVVAATTVSTSTTTGSARFAGGVGVAGRTSTATLSVGSGSPLDLVATGIATLDFPSLEPNGGVEDINVTIAGARVGDAVNIVESGGSFAPAGVVVRAIVTADDTVTVRATNVTAAAINPPAAPYRITVLSF